MFKDTAVAYTKVENVIKASELAADEAQLVLSLVSENARDTARVIYARQRLDYIYCQKDLFRSKRDIEVLYKNNH